jgi:thiamine pyrophosphate-dependent acetolactate synthase large subunit-like protein
MNPAGIARAILAAAPDALVVSSLGTATSALRAASEDGPHLYMGGSMGTALAAALGVAEKRRSREVIALLGDGEALMGAGSFWSLAGIAPPNLLAVVLVDGHYTITGDQPLGVPDVFGGVAAALGLQTATARSYDEVGAHVEGLGRPAVLEVRYEERTWPGPSPFVDPPVVRWRFEQAAGISAAPPRRAGSDASRG